MSELATIPYGQYRKGELKPVELDRVAAFWKEYFSVDNNGKPRNAAAFPYPSFENWAAMTSYDRDAADGTGGPGFQNLMRLLLCGVTRASGTNYNEQGEKVLAEDTRYISENYKGQLYWDCEDSEYGAMFQTKEKDKKKYTFNVIPPETWFKDVNPNDNQEYGIPVKVKKGGRPSGTHVSHHSRPFIPIKGKGYRKAGLYHGVLTTGNGEGSNPLAENFGTRFGYYPCTVMDFLTKANVKRINNQKTPANNVGQSYTNVGIGPGELEDCWEISKISDDEVPCILARNKLAAYFGLYYYADCRDPRLNWTVYETIEGETYESQMRCPNPKFGAVGWYKKPDKTPFEHDDKLFVREPLNPLNKKALENTKPIAKSYALKIQANPKYTLKDERNFDHVGGKHQRDDPSKPESKFEVPDIIHSMEGKATHSPWGALIDPSGFTLVQPFWYPADIKKTKWYLMNPGNHVTFRHHEHLEKLEIKCVSTPIRHASGLFGFGFRVPAAFLTWPNYYVKGKTNVRTERPKQGEVRKAPQYMTEPALVANIDQMMSDLATAQTLEQAKAKLPQYVITEEKVTRSGKVEISRIQLSRALLDFRERYETLNEAQWRLALLRAQFPDGTPQPKPPPIADPVDTATDTAEPPPPSKRKARGKTKAAPQAAAQSGVQAVEAPPPAPASSSGVERPARRAAAVKAQKAFEAREDQGDGDGVFDDDADDEDAPEVEGAVEDKDDEVEDEDAEAVRKEAKRVRKTNRIAPQIGEGDEYDSDVPVEGGEEQETERVDLVGVVLAQYDEMKELGELKEGDLSIDGADLATAVRYLINRSKRYVERPTATKYHVLFKILTYANMLVSKLEPGRVEPKKGELNCHFKEERLQAFGYHSIYDEGRLNFQYEDTTQEAQEEFARKNGRDAQTYAVNGKTAQVLKGYETTFGRAKGDVLDRKISEFRDDYMRILAIYFSNRGVGSTRLGFDVQQKRTGMLAGLWRFNEERNSPQYVQAPVWFAKKGYEPNAKTGTQIWQPVFKGFDKKKLDGNELTKMVGKPAAKAFARYFLDQTDAYWDNDVFEDIALPESDMTVREWVTTPWHLHHLPYQMQYAVFRDGDAFCEGCKRCSRPFYEYEHLLYSVDKPYLTTALWQQLDDDDGRLARVPIHDPQFKLESPKKALSAAEIGYKPKAPTNPNKRPIPIVKDANTLDKPVYINDGQQPDGEPFEPEPGTYNFSLVMLKKENVHVNDRKKSVFLKGYNSGGVPFRKYTSPVYSEARKHMYKGMPNGYMMVAKTFGRPDHRVVRSHKFGNTCRDCQHILQNAPGLFEQNNRYAFGPQEPNAGKQQFATLPRENMYDKLFKPAKDQRRDDETLDDTLERIRASLAARNKLPPGWSKIVDVDIAINRDPRRVEKPSADTKQAEEDLAFLLSTGRPPANPDWLKNPALRRSLEQLRSKFTHTRQTERVQSATGRFEAGIQRHEYRNCILRYEFEKDDQTFNLEWLNPSPELCEGFSGVSGWEAEGPDGRLKFDGKEQAFGKGCALPGDDAYFGRYTIARLSKAKRPYTGLPDGSKVYYNCLITRQYDPVNDPTKKKRYRVEAYVATLRGEEAEVVEQPPGCESQWQGDGYLLYKYEGPGDRQAEWFRDARQVWYQLRELVQTRVFITYSLHRPVNGTREGEDILRGHLSQDGRRCVGALRQRRVAEPNAKVREEAREGASHRQRRQHRLDPDRKAEQGREDLLRRSQDHQPKERGEQFLRVRHV